MRMFKKTTNYSINRILFWAGVTLLSFVTVACGGGVEPDPQYYDAIIDYKVTEDYRDINRVEGRLSDPSLKKVIANNVGTISCKNMSVDLDAEALRKARKKTLDVGKQFATQGNPWRDVTHISPENLRFLTDTLGIDVVLYVAEQQTQK